MIRPRDIDYTSALNALFSSEAARFAGYNIMPTGYGYNILEETDEYTVVDLVLDMPDGSKVKRVVKAYKGEEVIWPELMLTGLPVGDVSGPFSVAATFSNKPNHVLQTVVSTPSYLVSNITETGIDFTLIPNYSGESMVGVRATTNLGAEFNFAARVSVPKINPDALGSIRVSTTADGTGPAPSHYLVGDKVYVVVDLVGIDSPEYFNVLAYGNSFNGNFTVEPLRVLNQDTTLILEYTITELTGSSPTIGFVLQQGFAFQLANTPSKFIFATAGDVPTISLTGLPTGPVSANFTVGYTLTPATGHWLTEVEYDKPGLNHVIFGDTLSLRINAGWTGHETIQITARTDKGAEATFSVELNVA